MVVAVPSQDTSRRKPRERARKLRRVVTALLAAAFVNVVYSAQSMAQACEAYPDPNDCPDPLAVETPRGLALGTGLRASAISTSALAYSPAALGIGSLYHLEAHIDYLASLNTVALGAAAVDSSTSSVGAGVSLRGFVSGDDGYDVGDRGYDVDGLDGRLGLAVALSRAFALGVSARYIDVSTEVDPETARELAAGFTMDASLRVTPVEGLQVDVGALNFIDLDTPFVPFMLTGSVAVAAADALSLGADVLANLSSFEDPQLTLGFGVEYLGGNAVPVRGGYSFDIAREIHALGVGVGYTDQRVGLDLGVRQELAGGSATRVMASVRYHVN